MAPGKRARRRKVVGSTRWLLLLALVSGGCRTRLRDIDTPFDGTDLSQDLVSVPLLPPCAGQRSASSWAMERGDAHHLGRSNHVSAQSGRVKWTYDTGTFWSSSSPTIGADGTVYFGTSSGELHAVVGATGKHRWKFSAGAPIYSAAAIASNNTVFVSARVGRVDQAAQATLYAIDGATGTERWRAPGGVGGGGSPALAADGTIYWGNQAIDGATGVTKWTLKLADFVQVSPAIGDDCTVYIASGISFYAVDPRGAITWTFPNASFLVSVPALAAGTVYFCGGDSVLRALDAATGTERWKFSAWNGQNWIFQAVGADGTVFFSHRTRDKGYVVALDGASGKTKWTYESSESYDFPGSPVVGGDETVYFASQLGAVHALDGATGLEKWRAHIDAAYPTSPAIGNDGTLYVMAGDVQFGRISVKLVALGP